MKNIVSGKQASEQKVQKLEETLTGVKSQLRHEIEAGHSASMKVMRYELAGEFSGQPWILMCRPTEA